MNDQNRQTVFSSLLQSCVSFRFYAELLQSRQRRPLAYLTLLAAIAAASFTLYANQVILPKLDEASDKFPPITIRNGKVILETEEEGPQSMTLYADREQVLRIDLDWGANRKIDWRAAPTTTAS